MRFSFTNLGRLAKTHHPSGQHHLKGMRTRQLKIARRRTGFEEAGAVVKKDNRGRAEEKALASGANRKNMECLLLAYMHPREIINNRCKMAKKQKKKLTLLKGEKTSLSKGN